MDASLVLFAVMTAALLAATAWARRLGNETRDVALLGTCGGLSGVGTVIAALL